MKRVFKKSELAGVTGYVDTIGTIRLFPLELVVRHYGVDHTSHTAEDCRRMKDCTLFGQPLIDAIKALGYELVDDLAVEAKPRTYTAREWLEKVIPNSGEWRKSSSEDYIYCHWSKAGSGVAFTKDGNVSHTLRPLNYNDYSNCRIIDRSTAIDLMVQAIEGEQHAATSDTISLDTIAGITTSGSIGTDINASGFQKAAIESAKFSSDHPAQPDPYSHLPQGGRWSFNMYHAKLFHWPDDDKAKGRRFKIDGTADSEPDGGNWCESWRVCELIVKQNDQLITRAQAIAIIEQHKAEQAKPAPAEQKPEAAKVDTLGNLVNALWGITNRTEATIIANAIDAHMKALIQEAK